MENHELDNTLIKILSLSNINHFTATEIRTAYIAIQQDVTLDPADVRRFVYEELLKQIRRGWLTKSTTKKRSITRYTKTELFDYSFINKTVLTIENKIKNNTLNYSEMLVQRLNEHNSALLEGLGAVKEYITLKEMYPERHKLLKERYMTVQENNHILKGKIAALNELIQSNKET